MKTQRPTPPKGFRPALTEHDAHANSQRRYSAEYKVGRRDGVETLAFKVRPGRPPKKKAVQKVALTRFPYEPGMPGAGEQHLWCRRQSETLLRTRVNEVLTLLETRFGPDAPTDVVEVLTSTLKMLTSSDRVMVVFSSGSGEKELSIESHDIAHAAREPRPLSHSDNVAAPPDDPLASARARGRRFAAEQYESPDNLALLDARDYAGRNERSINEQRQTGALYALLPPGKSRGFRYPKWQFDADPERLGTVLQSFVAARTNCWVIHSFMTRRRDALGAKSPAQIILDDTKDLQPVVELAERDLAGEQGAL